MIPLLDIFARSLVRIVNENVSWPRCLCPPPSLPERNMKKSGGLAVTFGLFVGLYSIGFDYQLESDETGDIGNGDEFGF